MRAFLLLALAASLSAQDRPAAARAGLQLRVVESSGPAHVAGSRSRSVMTVEVADANGEPVASATVTFQLPASGPGGVFGNGSASDVVVTGPDGRAAAGGVTWGKTPGAFVLSVSASKGPARVAASFPHRILVPLDQSPRAASAARGRKKYLVMLAGAAAGAAAAGLAVSRRQPAGSAAAPGTPAASVSPPAITIGAP